MAHFDPFGNTRDEYQINSGRGRAAGRPGCAVKLCACALQPFGAESDLSLILARSKHDAKQISS